jgi:hypothetical protein
MWSASARKAETMSARRRGPICQRTITTTLLGSTGRKQPTPSISSPERERRTIAAL